jgi:hypothetical protein
MIRKILGLPRFIENPLKLKTLRPNISGLNSFLLPQIIQSSNLLLLSDSLSVCRQKMAF